MTRAQARRDGAVIALVACAMLVYEILLTRVCALRTAFHFSFLVISNGLLGVGAAGTALYLARERIKGLEERWVARLCWLFALSLPLVYALLLAWPVPAQVSVREVGSLLQFTAFSLGAAIPFVFAGGSIGLILSVHAARVHPYYALDLGGAAIGCLLCPPLLWWAGAGGALGGSFLLAFVGALSCGATGGLRRRLTLGTPLVVAAAVVVPFIDGWFPVPAKHRVQIIEEISIDPAEHLVESRWSAISRIDIVAIPDDQRHMFMKGHRAPTAHPERQCYVMQDGSAGTFIHDFSGTPEGLVSLERSLYSTSIRTLEPDSVFIIGAGGASDLWAASHGGAKRVKGIELNRQIIDILRGRLADWSRDLLERPGVELVHGEGRHALITEDETWDLVQMSAIDTWTSLVSGAYMLAENYLYTLDAVEDMFRVLSPNGAVQVTRFSGEVEALRLLATIERAHREYGEGEFADSVACLQSGTYMSILCKRRPFTADERENLDRFLDESGLDPVYHPSRALGGVVEAFIRSGDKDQFLADAPWNSTPVSDDKPYFFNFSRWDDPSGAWQTLDAPMVVTQGNPLFLFGQLGFSALAGVLLIVAPLVLRRRGADIEERSGAAVAGVVFFGAVGFGFIALEIALMQKLVLLLGHPLYSITISLFGMLLFTGLSALLFERYFSGPTGRFWLVPAALTVTFLIFGPLSAEIVRAATPLPLVGRAVVALAILAPVGLALGIPFAHGIRLLERRAPALVPWAWATNATSTVVGSIATVILSMNFGFNAVFAVGTLAYWIAGLGARSLARGISAE